MLATDQPICHNKNYRIFLDLGCFPEQFRHLIYPDCKCYKIRSYIFRDIAGRSKILHEIPRTITSRYAFKAWNNRLCPWYSEMCKYQNHLGSAILSHNHTRDDIYRYRNRVLHTGCFAIYIYMYMYIIIYIILLPRVQRKWCFKMHNRRPIPCGNWVPLK